MTPDDNELMRLVTSSDEFKRAETINEVRGVVRRVLKKRLIDMHIHDSQDVRVREDIVNRHIELITLKILKEFDGIILLSRCYDELESFGSIVRCGSRKGRFSKTTL